MIDEYSTWRRKYNEYWKHNSEKSEFWDSFEDKIINSFNKYMLPVIDMKKENSKEAVCQVFEKVNTGGVSLTVFELLTATFAADSFDLKANWEYIKGRFKEHKVLHNTGNTDVIQAVSLLTTYKRKMAKIAAGTAREELPAVSCKRKDLLNLALSDYESNAEPVADGFIRASKILVENHIYNARDLPYNTQLVPMAAILAILGDKIENAGNRNKLMRWFWCGVFGELYGSANETRYALDVIQVVDWIESNGEEPKTVYDANFAPSRLNTLRTRNSAAYKGIYALLLDENTRDWISAKKIDLISYFSESIDIHHIFPVAWCEKNGKDINDYNSIINKTPLSGRTNRIVSGDAPSKYLARVKSNAGVTDEEFNSILKSHVLEPDYLYNDDFKGFFADRKEQILKKIESATGKKISRDAAQIEEGVFKGDQIDDEETE